MSNLERLHLVLKLLSSFNRLEFVKVKIEVGNASRLSEFLETGLHVSEKSFLFLEVLFLFFFHLNFNDSLELAHKLLGRDLA